MSGFIQGARRTQATLFPDRLDDYITEENTIRAIDAFVDSLDLLELGYKTVSADTGRPAYHPSTTLKLFLYSYLNRVQCVPLNQILDLSQVTTFSNMCIFNNE